MAEHGKILVSGATGTVGGQVVKQLAAAGVDVQALARNPDAVVLPDGVEVMHGDLSDPASLEQPLRDVGAVFLVWPFLTSAGADDVLDVIKRIGGPDDDDSPQYRNGTCAGLSAIDRQSPP